MPEKYRNFRNSVPWLLLILEVVFIILFYFLSPDEKNISMLEFSYPGKICSLVVKGRVNACLCFTVQQ